MYYTYLIRSKKDNRWYTGCTSDLRKRFKRHVNGEILSTKGRGPFELIYYEACNDKSDAYTREKYLKTGMGKRYLKNRLKRFLALTGLVILTSFSLHMKADAAVLQRPPNNLGLVGYWSFNEGTSTIAGDFSGNGNNGTLTGMANPPTATSGWGDGKRGKALNFDGVDDAVSVAPNSSINDISSLTISTWVYPRTEGELNRGGILRKENFPTAGWDFGFDSAGTNALFFRHFYDGGTNLIRDSSDSAVTLNKWNYITLTWDGSTTATGIKFYVNGIETGYDTTQNGVGNRVSDASSNLDIGIAPAANTWDGLIDDVRIYNRALTAAEVKALYQSGAVAINSSQNNRLKDGLVGLWSFNGGDMNGNTAYDRSGSNNNGTLTNGPTRTIGKIGQALSFGVTTGDVVTILNPGNLDPDSSIVVWTAWIYPTTFTNGRRIMAKNAQDGNGGPAFFIQGTGGDISFNWGRATVNGLASSNNTPLALGRWAFVAGVWNPSDTQPRIYVNGIEVTYVAGATWGSGASASTADLTIGNLGNVGPTSAFQGNIDEARYYNRVLSVSEVKALYQSGAVAINSSQNNRLKDGLVGLWSFNGGDMNGNTAYDRSGSNNNGTLTNGPTKTIGKIGQALSFDGVNDYVNVNPANSVDNAQMTYSAWIYPINTTSGEVIYTGIGTTAHGRLYKRGGPPRIEFDYVWVSGICKANTPPGSAPVNTWTHVVATYDRSLACSASTRPRIYINGVDVSTTDTVNGTGGALTGANVVNIGASLGPTLYFPGIIDDVRIYNRALSASEIKQLYLMGK
ncbi:MAG: hypothetical protein A3B08_02015 [Candidatus Taylorbacteria bacterium RIFCSPLOWO2_01_FULL_43_44]|nr:MAG: hypothetical protein A3B08_02015 [Candidatus Taylorbacteria bacterium RIFCSPLOWO2_01_FULL_43_44]